MAAPGKLTVVQLLPALNAGGVERGTVEIARALVAAGHRSIVISAGGRLVNTLVDEGSEHLCWPIGQKSPWTLRLVPKLRRYLAAQQVDILHARSRLPAWIGYLAWKRMPETSRPRFVTTAHGMHSVNRYSAIMTRGERVIAVSETSRRYLLDNYPGIDPGIIRVIHRGIDSREFPHGYRPSAEWLQRWYESFPQLRNRYTIVLPGRLTWWKGHRDLIELMTRLREAGIDACGVIVGGEDPQRRKYGEEIRTLVRERGLDNVLFTGHRNDMREIYSVADLVLSLTRDREESFGRTVVEALSLGTPVIGYDRGGVSETLATLFPAGRVPPGDLESLTRRVGEFIRRPPPVAENNHFTLEKMTATTLALYADLAGLETAPSP